MSTTSDDKQTNLTYRKANAQLRPFSKADGTKDDNTTITLH